MTVLAVLAAFVAGWVGFAPSAVTRLRPVEGGAVWPSSQRWLGPALPFVLVAVVSIVGLMLWGSVGGSVAFAVTLPLVTAWTVWRRHRRRSVAAAAARDVATACQQLAGLLRVGHVPGVALSLAAQDSPVLADAAAIQAIGGEVAVALRRQGAGPGNGGLAQLAIAWDVAERTGASLTATLDALSERLAADRVVHNVVAAELSGPRATGRLLAVLPLAGLGLGYGFGGDPLDFLTASMPGQLCLTVGALLGCTGVFWTERIAGSEEDPK